MWADDRVNPRAFKRNATIVCRGHLVAADGAAELRRRLDRGEEGVVAVLRAMLASSRLQRRHLLHDLRHQIVDVCYAFRGAEHKHPTNATTHTRASEPPPNRPVESALVVGFVVNIGIILGAKSYVGLMRLGRRVRPNK